MKNDDFIQSNQSTTNDLQKYHNKIINHNRHNSALNVNSNFVRKNYWINRHIKEPSPNTSQNDSNNMIKET